MQWRNEADRPFQIFGRIGYCERKNWNAWDRKLHWAESKNYRSEFDIIRQRYIQTTYKYIGRSMVLYYANEMDHKYGNEKKI